MTTQRAKTTEQQSIYNIAGARLKVLRAVNGLTQVKLGYIIGSSGQQVQKYETGANRLPIDKLAILVKRFGLSYDFFFKEIDLSK